MFASPPPNAANTILPAAAGGTQNVWNAIERTRAPLRISRGRMLDIVMNAIASKTSLNPIDPDEAV
jgi:hypothetical protein